MNLEIINNMHHEIYLDHNTLYYITSQASVPFGVMMGYIIASVLTSVSNHYDTCLGLLCWRWPFLIEIMLLTPLYFGLYFIPSEDLAVCVGSKTKRSLSNSNNINMSRSNSSGGVNRLLQDRDCSGVKNSTSTVNLYTNNNNNSNSSNINQSSPLKSITSKTGISQYGSNSTYNIPPPINTTTAGIAVDADIEAGKTGFESPVANPNKVW